MFSKKDNTKVNEMKKLYTTSKYFVLGVLILATFMPAILELAFGIVTGLTDNQLWLWTIGGLIISGVWLFVPVRDPKCENN